MATANRSDSAHGRTRAPLPARAQAQLLTHLDAAYGLARWLVGDEWLAEDIVQQAYQAALQQADDLEDDGVAKTWLLRHVHHAAHDWLARHRQTPAAQTEPDDAATPPDRHRPETDPTDLLRLLKPGRKQVNAALARLDLPLREALVLHEIEDLAPSQMAQVLALTESEVRAQLARGRRQLALLLRDGDRQPQHER